MKFLLSVIALCLVMITAKLYIPEAQAADMTTGKVMNIVENRCLTSGSYTSNKITCS